MKDSDATGVPRSPGRRAFLAGAAAAAGSASVAAASGAADDWSRRQGAPISNPGYGAPSPFEKAVTRRSRLAPPFPTAASSLTPLSKLHSVITPAGLHFERHHGGVPAIDPDRHRLMIHGLVERPLLFTMDDIVRFPSVSRLHFLECSGNTPGWAEPNPKFTVQDTHGLLSCSEWTGVRLSTLLDEAGARPEARWILAEGADAALMTRSIPIEKALDDVIVAYAQNGERLRPEQGYPLRLFVPGFEGNVSVKWLRRLKLDDRPQEGREETSKYTDLMPDGRARQFTFLMEAKSVITSPSGGEALQGPGFREISGLAWSGQGKVKRVDVSVDGGATWREAALQEPVLPKCLTRFRLPWTWDGAPAALQSRAVDESGYVQPTRAKLIEVRGVNSLYHFNGIQTWRVSQTGEVVNAA